MKLTISRLFDATRLLATQAGNDISELVEFTQTFAEQTLRALRNGLSFEDNVKCTTPVVILKHGVPQVLNVTGTVVGIIPTRVFGVQGISSLSWFYDKSGRLNVVPSFTSSQQYRSASVSNTLAVITVRYDAHDFGNGSKIFVSNAVGTGSLPSGLYIVSNATANTFDFTAGVAPATITSLDFQGDPSQSIDVRLIVLLA